MQGATGLNAPEVSPASSLADIPRLHLLFAPRGLLGQDPNHAVGPDRPAVQSQLQMIKLSSRLRIHTGASRMEGHLVGSTANSLVIRDDGQETGTSLAEIDSLWVRRHRLGLGFLAGTAVGALGYVVITSQDDDLDNPWLDNLFGAAFWVGSAVLGTVVGGLLPHWKRVYP